MTRTVITNNDIGSIPTVPVFVGFTINDQERPFTEAEINTIIDRVFVNDNSLNAYYRELSYNEPTRLELQQDGSWNVVVENSPDHYSWDFVPGEFDPQKPKDLVTDAFQIILDGNLETDFQDRLILLFLNATTSEIQGRGAMGLVPGGCDYPYLNPPSSPEFFVGHPRLPGGGFDYSRRASLFIDNNFTFSQYMILRNSEFDNNNDQFTRGVCLFCRDSLRSCAVHDVIHAVRRLSGEKPGEDFPGRRARAVPCLYNLFIQGHWITNGCDRSIYCTPYVGWWDNTGDHLHFQIPRPFFSCPPYGVSAFTRLRLDMIPSAYVGTAVEAEQPFQLAPLAVQQLPQQTGGQPVLVVKVPLSGTEPGEYLLVEYRRRVPGSVDDITVNPDRLLGESSQDPGEVNPPAHIVSQNGVLIYHVNEEKSQFAGEPSNFEEDVVSNPTFIQDFVLYLYTPLMMTETGALNWENRTKEGLKTPAFRPGTSPFKLLYPFDTPTELVEVYVDGLSITQADIRVVRSTV
jgi:hypothetical protein